MPAFSNGRKWTTLKLEFSSAGVGGWKTAEAGLSV